jgi:hypothetical protein
MELRRPPCRDMQAHDAHGFFALPRYEAWNDCPGWTETEAASADLVRQVIGLPREERSTATLQCNPSVMYYLLSVLIPGYREFVSQMSQLAGGVASQGLGVPVMLCPAMDRGAWRLTVRAGRDTIAEGVVPVAA